MADTDEKRTTAMDWARFILGGGMTLAMLYVQYVKGVEINLFLYAIPAGLLGLDPSKIIGGKK
ncbi:MAG: hypothetical protein AAF468_20685 [Pseudomonadota bacterium]